MVLDLKKIHLNKAIEDDALWIVEQIPRYCQCMCMEYWDDALLITNAWDDALLITNAWDKCFADN